MLVVNIQIVGSREVQRKLAKLGQSLFMMKGAMGEIGDRLKVYYANDAFNSKGGVFKQQWAPLNPTYAALKRKKWGSKPTLVASGAMRKSFYARAGDQQVIVTNLAKQFKYHQSSSTRYVLPRRQMIGVNTRVKKIVEDIIREDIKKKLRAM